MQLFDLAAVAKDHTSTDTHLKCSLDARHSLSYVGELSLVPCENVESNVGVVVVVVKAV